MACNNCYPQPCNCNCPDPLVPCNGNGCIQSITSSCVTYDGNNVDCAGIAEGQTLNQVIEELGTTVCQLFDDVTSFSNFKCTDLSGCSIDALGDVQTPSPVSGEVLIFNGTNWVNDTIVVPDPFTCSDLNGCSINDLGDVITTSAVSGDILIYNGTNWVIGTIPTPPTPTAYTSNNGITKTSYNFQLGGDLVKNTSITGANFDLALGESSSKIDLLSARTNTIDLQSSVISLNTTTLGTQTKGFLFKDSKTSISLGTNVFDDFDTYNGLIRIGSEITAAGSVVAGTFIGTNMTLNGLFPRGLVANAIGSNMTLTNALGFYMGVDLIADGGILGVGGTSFGAQLRAYGSGVGNQSAWLFGAATTINFGLEQGSVIVFNPSATEIASSATGNADNELVKIPILGAGRKFITTINSSEYYFFTTADDNTQPGWNVNTRTIIMKPEGVRVPISSEGSNPNTLEGMIRYNGSKLQVYNGSAWETVSSS